MFIWYYTMGICIDIFSVTIDVYASVFFVSTYRRRLNKLLTKRNAAAGTLITTYRVVKIRKASRPNMTY